MSSNVIDFASKRKQKGLPAKSAGAHLNDSELVDLAQKRAEEIDQDRREVRRTILTDFVSTYVVLPNIGLQSIGLYDISRTGISFDLEFRAGRFDLQEEVAVRIYLNKNTFFPFVVKIENVREIPHDNVHRHGATIVTGTVNDEALHHFISFIETVSATVMTDDGDIVVNNLNT